MYDPSEALLQLGLYDYVWGNPALLQTYNSNVQAEKAMAEQAQYNKLWKQIEDEKNAAAAIREKKMELAKLYKDYNNAQGAQERALISRQITELENELGNTNIKNEMLEAYDADRAEADAYLRAKADFRSKAPHTFADDKAIEAEIQRTMADQTLKPNDKEDYIKELQGKKSTAQMKAEAAQNADVGFTGKKRGQALEVSDILARSKQTGYYPSTSDKATMKAAGYIWDKIKRQYIGI